MSSEVREVLAVAFVLAVVVVLVLAVAFAGAFVVAVPFPLLVFLPTAKSRSSRPKLLTVLSGAAQWRNPLLNRFANIFTNIVLRHPTIFMHHQKSGVRHSERRCISHRLDEIE